MSRHRFALALIVLAAFALGAWRLSAQSFWYDEAYTVVFARNSVPDIVAGAATRELNTPLHYLALKLWIALGGAGEFATRLLSVSAGALTVALASRLPGRDPAAQRWSAALVATSAVLLNMAQETRMYALAIALNTLSVVLCLRLRRGQSGAAWAVVCVVALCTHVLSAFVFAGQCLILLARERRIRPAMLAAGTAIGAIGAALFLLRTDYGTNFGARPEFGNILTQATAATLLPRLAPEALIPAAALACTALLALGLLRHRALGLIALFSVIAIAVFSIATAKFAGRYLAITVPLMLAALAGVRVSRNAERALLTFALLTNGIGSGAWLTQRDPAYANEDYRAAVAYLRANTQPDEAIVLLSGHAWPAVEVYWPEGRERNWHALPFDAVLDTRNAIDYERAAPLLNQALSGKRGAWLLLWQDVVIDPASTTQMLLRRQANQLQHDREMLDFHGLRLLHYTFDAPYAPTPPTLSPRLIDAAPNGPDSGLTALGCAQLTPANRASKLIELNCLWRKARDASAPLDTQVSLRLNDTAGKRVSQRDAKLATLGLPYLAFDKPILTVHYLDLPADAPAGQYTVEAVLYTGNGELSPKLTTRVDVE
jgi:mannosyltransferase